MKEVLPKLFYREDTEYVARALIGKILCVRTERGIERGRIVETEAYLGESDRACHSFGGRRTARNESMYGDAGQTYVYFIYGMYFCLNAVTREAGIPEAVLIRAVEPLDSSRMTGKEKPTNGPGKLCRFYGIDREDDGLKLYSKRSRIFIEDDGTKIVAADVTSTRRVGIDSSKEARDLPLRFHLRGNPFVSKLR